MQQQQQLSLTDDPPSGICCRVGAGRRFGNINKRLGNEVPGKGFEIKTRISKFKKKEMKKTRTQSYIEPIFAFSEPNNLLALLNCV